MSIFAPFVALCLKVPFLCYVLFYTTRDSKLIIVGYWGISFLKYGCQKCLSTRLTWCIRALLEML